MIIFLFQVRLQSQPKSLGVAHLKGGLVILIIISATIVELFPKISKKHCNYHLSVFSSSSTSMIPTTGRWLSLWQKRWEDILKPGRWWNGYIWYNWYMMALGIFWGSGSQGFPQGCCLEGLVWHWRGWPWHWGNRGIKTMIIIIHPTLWWLSRSLTKEGAGSRGEAGPNLIHFIRKLKSLAPGFLVTQPTYGYPQVDAFQETRFTTTWRCKQRLMWSTQAGMPEEPAMVWRTQWGWWSMREPRCRQK